MLVGSSAIDSACVPEKGSEYVRAVSSKYDEVYVRSEHALAVAPQRVPTTH